MNTARSPIIHPLKNCAELELGGKARGLAQLMRIPLKVPDGFVIEHAASGAYPAQLLEQYQAIGAGAVAVRSSALGEDGGDNSFAGQFETLLNVKGELALKSAIDQCVQSLANERAAAYQQQREHNQETRMCVVVQTMVDAAAAGVLFSADPVSGRHDRLVIDAVAGLGEALVSGESESDHYLLDEENRVLKQQTVGETAILSDQQLQQLADEARKAVSVLGEPLDMEWAIDKNGELFWLQARPITTIGSDLNELDTPVPDNHVVTRCNVGEIFPGACPPLTYSVVGKAIDSSMQSMSGYFCGRQTVDIKPVDQFRYVAGHLFIDLTASVAASRYTLLAKAEATAQSICGRTIPELIEPDDKKNILRRVWGIKDFIVYIFRASKTTAEFAQRLKAFYIEYHHNSAAMYQELDKKRHWMTDASNMHLRSSAMSGTMEGVIQGIISKGAATPSLEDQAMAAKLFAGASQVESAVLVDQLDHVVDLIGEHSEGKERFHDVDTATALHWLRSEVSGAAGAAFTDFLQQHGHRCYKELCLMTPAWADQPETLVESMQASLMARYQTSGGKNTHDVVNMREQPRLIRWLLPKAHAAIRGREYSKSMMVRVAHQLKRGYRHLGGLLAQEGRLESADLVYFLTHEELGELINDQKPLLAEQAKKRRISYAFQDRLYFQDIYQGKPEPVELALQQLEDGQLAGRAVSKGVVEGHARVARNLSEAASLQPGEILIAPVTDVGWTPYFSLIAGLATDVGSAVSHGAVIAREYGLPCVVNLQVATSTFQTGDRIRLDADTGVLTLLEAAGKVETV